MLATKVVELDSKDKYGQTPLSLASRKGHDKIVELLRSKDAVDPNSKDDFDQTPLSWAVRNGHSNIVDLLLRRRRENGIVTLCEDLAIAEPRAADHGGGRICDACLLSVHQLHLIITAESVSVRISIFARTVLPLGLSVWISHKLVKYIDEDTGIVELSH